MEKGIALIEQNRPQWMQLCRKHEVARLYLFGSALTDRFDRQHNSDLDFLIALDPTLSPVEKGERLLQLWGELEALFQRPVDLITENSLHNPFLKRQIDATKILLYERPSA